MNCHICNEKIRDISHKIKIGKNEFNLCEDCFVSHLNNVRTFYFDDTIDEAVEKYSEIYNDMVNANLPDELVTLKNEYCELYFNMKDSTKNIIEEIEKNTKKLNKLKENQIKEKEELETIIENLNKEKNDIESNYIDKLKELEDDMKDMDYDILKELPNIENTISELYKIRGNNHVCNRCCKVLDKSRKLKLKGVTAYFCADCFEEVVDDNDVETRSALKTINKDKVNKCSSCDKHLNKINRKKVYLINDEEYTYYCKDCYKDYIEEYKSTVEYKSGVKRRIFSILLFIVFGVLGYFLIKSLIPTYNLELPQILLISAFLLLLYSAYACRILKINFVYKIAEFINKIKNKLTYLLFGKDTPKSLFRQEKEEGHFFKGLIMFILLGIISILVKTFFFVVFGILKIIFTLPFGIFTLPFAYRRSKIRFDLYYVPSDDDYYDYE